jgi:hypothetical protein
MYYTRFLFENILPYNALNLYLADELNHTNLMSIQLIIKHLETQNDIMALEALAGFKLKFRKNFIYKNRIDKNL